jgi:hypothetical protein
MRETLAKRAFPAVDPAESLENGVFLAGQPVKALDVVGFSVYDYKL